MDSAAAQLGGGELGHQKQVKVESLIRARENVVVSAAAVCWPMRSESLAT